VRGGKKRKSKRERPQFFSEPLLSLSRKKREGLRRGERREREKGGDVEPLHHSLIPPPPPPKTKEKKKKRGGGFLFQAIGEK